MADYETGKKQNYVSDPKWEKQIELAIELACLRGDVESVKSNPIARIALSGALDS